MIGHAVVFAGWFFAVMYCAMFAQISDAVWLALIGVLAMAVKEYFDRVRAKEAAIKVDTVVKDVDAIHKATNSMKDKLLETTQRAAQSEGEAKGRADQREEAKVDMKETALRDHKARIDAKEARVDAKEVKADVKIIKQDVDDVKAVIVPPDTPG